jgi:hypothetical protein
MPARRPSRMRTARSLLRDRLLVLAKRRHRPNKSLASPPLLVTRLPLLLVLPPLVALLSVLGVGVASHRLAATSYSTQTPSTSTGPAVVDPSPIDPATSPSPLILSCLSILSLELLPACSHPRAFSEGKTRSRGRSSPPRLTQTGWTLPPSLRPISRVERAQAGRQRKRRRRRVIRSMRTEMRSKRRLRTG